MMKTLTRLLLIFPLVFVPLDSSAQSTDRDDAESLKLAALEALISAPPERAMPLVNKVLAGSHSVEVKERALFILSQVDSDEAQSTLLRFAREDGGELQSEAIRMIGIGGDEQALAGLAEIYESGNAKAREAILEAYLIADDKAAIFEIAVNADNEEEFSDAVNMLGAMGAREELRQLRGRTGNAEPLIEAYAVSGDFETLREIALDQSDSESQTRAIEALGIVGGDQVDATLLEIYRDADSDEVRSAALQGMLISGYDGGVLELYRNATDAGEKRELLEYLVMMDSDAVWDAIDAALEGAE